MGGILEEGLLPLRLLFNVPAEAEAQQAHDGGDRQQHRKERYEHISLLKTMKQLP